MHYVLIDKYSGYVWGEIDADDAIDACQKLDAEIGGPNREYERVNASDYWHSTASGYDVRRAPNGWSPVEGGRSSAEIERVEALPREALVHFKVNDPSAWPKLGSDF